MTPYKLTECETFFFLPFFTLWHVPTYFHSFYVRQHILNLWNAQLYENKGRAQRNGNTWSYNMSLVLHLNVHLYSFSTLLFFTNCQSQLESLQFVERTKANEASPSVHVATHLTRGSFQGKKGFPSILHKMSSQLTILNWFSFTLPNEHFLSQRRRRKKRAQTKFVDPIFHLSCNICN